MDTASSVTASLDMLRAAWTAADRLGRPLTGDLYIGTGFSQGGQVAMALGKALDGGADRHFRLKALAPVSGSYDLEGQEMPALFDGRVNDVSGVLYTAYWLVAQNRLHPLYKDPADAFRAPYATSRVERLLDGSHEQEEVVRGLAPSVRRLLTPLFYERLRHPSGAVLEAMRAADHTCDWKPEVPVRLYAAGGDTELRLHQRPDMRPHPRRSGTRVRVVEQGAVDGWIVVVSAPQVVRFFDGVRR
ncbi:hypothetical protein SFUMM280S_02714 [Streptomyces fumanus]